MTKPIEGLTDPAQAIADALKIFISYSRRDLAAADAMVAALEGHGFAVTIDRRDLPYGEEWQTELAGFIAASDTVVWLVSPDSVKSKWVNWELGEVGRLSKRLIPVKVRETPPEELPEALGRIHLLPAEGAYAPALHEEALVRALNTDRAWLKRATSLGEDAREWLANGRDKARLIRGAALSEAEAWSVRKPADAPAPSSDILELILASRAAQRRGQRMTVIGSLTAAVVAIGLAATAVWFGLRAEEQAAEAERQRLVAEENEKRASEQEKLALAGEQKARQNESLALAALSQVELSEDRPSDAVKLAVAAWPRLGDEKRPYLRATVDALTDAMPKAGEKFHIGNIGLRRTTLKFSADGTRLIAAGGPSAAKVWDAATGTELQGLIETRDAFDMAVSPDGTLVAATVGSELRLVEAATGTVARSVVRPGDTLLWVAFSPEGERVAVVGRTAAYIYDVSTGSLIATLAGNEGILNSIAFSDDGHRLVTTSSDGRARVWDASTGDGVLEFEVPDSPGPNFLDIDAFFALDGTRIVVVTPSAVSLWNASDGTQLATIREDDPMSMLKTRLSPTGTSLALSVNDSIHIMEMSTGNTRLFLSNRGVGSGDIRYSPDGKRIALGSGNSGLWEVDTGRHLVQLGAETAEIIAFSDGGKRVATAKTFSDLDEQYALLWSLAAFEEGDLVERACNLLELDVSLEEVIRRRRLGELTPICGDNPPLPVDWSKLQ